jgi:O-antigen ligase
MPTTRPSGSRRRTPASTPFTRRWGAAFDWKAEGDFMTLCLLLVLVALGGGSAFADTLSLVYVRLAAVIALAIFMLTPAAPDWRTLRVPFALLGLLAAIMLVQLVPLPPSMWTALPGRGAYVDATAGLVQPWRPLSLTPDLTMNSLVSLVVPAAVLLGFAKLDTSRRERLLIGFILLCLASIALGVAQLAGGANSPLYSYKRAHQGMPVGLLANRNHQAALLAALFPALRVWTLLPAAGRRWRERRRWLALALGVLATPVILATGSRAGIALTLGSLLATFALFSVESRRGQMATARSWRTMLPRLGIPALLIVMVLATWRFGRALSIQRFTGGYPSVGEDLRFQFAPVVIDIIRKTFPVGTGFGSFDPVFRQYEPDAALKNSYFNHAHNELLEVAMTAGIAGLVLLAAFLIWWALRVFGALRLQRSSAAPRFTLLGGTVVAILVLASLVDYPLRTPLLGAWFAIACGWLCATTTKPQTTANVAVPDGPL